MPFEAIMLLFLYYLSCRTCGKAELIRSLPVVLGTFAISPLLVTPSIR